MNIPGDLFYTEDHEWIRLEGDHAVVGITDYAQAELGDIVMVELPETGQTFQKGDTSCTLEAVKTVSDVFQPLSGEIVEVNTKLEAEPELINSDPYGEGWIMKIRLSNPEEKDQLLSAGAYEESIG